MNRQLNLLCFLIAGVITVSIVVTGVAMHVSRQSVSATQCIADSDLLSVTIDKTVYSQECSDDFLLQVNLRNKTGDTIGYSAPCPLQVTGCFAAGNRAKTTAGCDANGFVEFYVGSGFTKPLPAATEIENTRVAFRSGWLKTIPPHGNFQYYLTLKRADLQLASREPYLMVLIQGNLLVTDGNRVQYAYTVPPLQVQLIGGRAGAQIVLDSSRNRCSKIPIPPTGIPLERDDLVGMRYKSDVLLESDPASAAELSYSEGNYTRALYAANEAIMSGNKLERAHYCRARTYIQLGEFQKAISDCDRTVQLYSATKQKDARYHLPDAYAQRALAENGIGRYREAIRDSNKCLLLNDTHTYGLLARGETYLLTRRYDQAVEDLSRLISYHSGDLEVVAQARRLRLKALKALGFDGLAAYEAEKIAKYVSKSKYKRP